MEVTVRSPVLNNSTALHDTYRWALLSIYTLVLVGGSISMSLMINILQSNVRSVTTMAVINLIIVHTLFLLTVPFRIYSYITGEWRLGQGFCRVVSGMIHAHMYLAFMFYIIILVIRYLAFYKQRDRMEFYRTLHAVGASIAVWLLMLIVALPVAILEYGSTDSGNTTSTDTYQCFRFGGELNEPAVAIFNYILSSIIIIITLALTLCQIWILAQVYRTHGNLSFSHQEFWVQVKSLCFVTVMVVCFVPYNVFRIFYVKNVRDQASLEGVNEVFLAVTTLSCLDMLTFVGRGSNSPCPAGHCGCLL
ncbi:probable G-protein coupled receptor 141 [Centroberyx affinis]|uniref:probable G-protein coupled receptor 141 n=1 Tax=Centroberyx affinis TaxID=166261 RepID=UPI003A5C1B08